MTRAISDCRILTPDETLDSGTIAFDDSGRITAVGPEVRPLPGAETIDASGLTIVPGYIDLHVHGGGGSSLATRDPEEILSYARWVVSRGVTGFLATIYASGFEEALEFARAAAYVSDTSLGGAEVIGINLEGPFINPNRRGALPVGWVRSPDRAEFAALTEAADWSIKLMTIAPEVPGAEQIQQLAQDDLVAVAVGHTDATYEEARRAFDAGASHLTHAFNAMRPFHQRDPGPVPAALDSPQVTIELIADGVHLHPATLRWVLGAAGPDRIALISDGIPPAGLDVGAFRLGEHEARLEGGRALLPDGTIAGGVATMNAIVRNVVEWGVADLATAVRMASTVPAEVLGLAESKGRVAPGFDADLVALDPDLEVVMTWVGGRLVYSRPWRAGNSGAAL